MRGKRVWHFARKRRGYRPTFFFAKSTWEACVGRSLPSSFSFLPHFSLFPVFIASLGPDEDAGKSLQGCCGVCCVLGFPWGIPPFPHRDIPPITLGTSRTHTASFHPWETSPLISPHVQGYLTLVRKIPRILELPALPPGWKRLEVIHSSIQVLIESFWSPWKLSIEWLLTSYHAPLNQHFFIGFGFRSSKKDPLVSWMANFASLPFPFLHSTSPIYYWTASHPNLHGFQFNSLDYQINPFYYLSGFFI